MMMPTSEQYEDQLENMIMNLEKKVIEQAAEIARLKEAHEKVWAPPVMPSMGTGELPVFGSVRGGHDDTPRP